MRELKEVEIDSVSGGVGPGGAVIGAIAGGAAVAATGGNATQVVVGATFGAVAGFFGGIAVATTGATRIAFGAYSAGATAGGAVATQ